METEKSKNRSKSKPSINENPRDLLLTWRSFGGHST